MTLKDKNGKKITFKGRTTRAQPDANISIYNPNNSTNYIQVREIKKVFEHYEKSKQELMIDNMNMMTSHSNSQNVHYQPKTEKMNDSHINSRLFDEKLYFKSIETNMHK